MSMLDGLLELFGDTIVAHPGFLNEYGDWVASGTAFSLTCRIEGSTRLVRDPNGHEVVSTYHVIVASFNDLTVDEHRYTLPERYTPRDSLRAISVRKVSDETGPLYEVLDFP